MKNRLFLNRLVAAFLPLTIYATISMAHLATHEFQPTLSLRIITEVQADSVRLHAERSDNGVAEPVAWKVDPNNPAPTTLLHTDGASALVQFPNNAADGEYYFDALASDGRSKARTLIYKNENTLRAFDPAHDHASWIDHAIIYGVAPDCISSKAGRKLKDLESRLTELKALGINTLWIQPIFPTANGSQGYDVTDYIQVWKDLGTKADFIGLVERAHELKMHVVMDFVSNHTSVSHPYAQDIAKNGRNSRYYDFYSHEKDQAPYSENYHVRDVNGTPFIFYFWNDLLNLNYNNAEVRRYVIDALKYWISEANVDGFRFDAAWGPFSRRPHFFRQAREELKNLKPELLLLAEDKAPYPEAYKGTHYPGAGDIFDMAYDWTPSEQYISEWAWQAGAPEQTIFNHLSCAKRLSALTDAIDDYHQDRRHQARVLRYIEDNDTPRFIQNHSLQQTKLGAALTFTLPGTPLIYYGQEIATHEYLPSFADGRTIRSYDHSQIWPFYQKLIRVRKENPELSVGQFKRLSVDENSLPDQILAFERTLSASRRVVVVANLGDAIAEGRMELGKSASGFKIEDLLDTQKNSSFEQNSLYLKLSPSEVRILRITDPLPLHHERPIQ